MGILDDYLDPDRNLWNQWPQPPDGYDEAWEAINEFCGLDKDNRDESLVKKNIYKYTDCGAWVSFDDCGIRLGSIVEGSDVSRCEYPLPWDRITVEAITKRIDAIEKEADAIWKWANEEREDGKTDADSGLDCPDVGWEYRHLNE